MTHASRTLVRSCSAGLLALGALTLTACDTRTPEEKGRDYAEGKLGFAQGAADTLKEKGGDLGKSAGQGVGDLVRGIGTGAKDSATPEVKVAVQASARDAGVTVHHATEGGSEGDVRLIQVYAEFAKGFHGQLELLAQNAKGEELGRGVLEAPLALSAAKKEQLAFRFPGVVRFSHVTQYSLGYQPPATLALAPTLTDVRVSQLKVGEHKVSVYVQFDKAFKAALELRAYAADGSELGRSKKTAALKQAADSAEFIDFDFDPRVALEQVSKFELR